MQAEVIAGVDVGGTFTDILLLEEASGKAFAWKVPTTSENPARGVAAGVAEACAAAGYELDVVKRLHHGTTIATNAMLEHRGGPVGMLTTEGFRDILHIGRHQRPLNYSIMQDIPWQARPLIRRRDRLPVTERIGPDGAIIQPLDERAVRMAARLLAERKIRSIVVGFLFSFVNPAHELRARELIFEEAPEAFVTLSHEMTGQFREFERFTSAAVNGFVGEGVQRYISELEGQLECEGLDCELRVMTSAGSIVSAVRIAEKPALTLLSGPAAGVIGATWIGLSAGRRNLITFDVGGTSADISVVVDGAIREAGARDMAIAGFPVQFPMIDIETIGAGGGSIAYQDGGGAFRVGPASAGSRPGPAAYGQGGDLPTVTDAHVFLRRLDPGRFLGGRMKLDIAAASHVMTRLAETLGLSPQQTASGILRILNANMAEAIRSRTVRRGIDPRHFALVAFGGAGPLHAVEVAALLEIPEVIVPPYPGLTSAAGLVTTDLRYDHVRSAFLRSDRDERARFAAILGELEERVRADFARDGDFAQDATITFSADTRYAGQGYELRIPVDLAAGDPLGATAALFHEAHARDYGRAFYDRTVEFVNLRASGRRVSSRGGIAVSTGEAGGGAEVARELCCFMTATGIVERETPFLMRWRLPQGSEITGPAILLQDDTTIVVPPGSRAHCHASGSVIITLAAEAAH
ncbi:MAG: hydantoinase/oxoprolinase family protein [Alphaproteobacteria bacterium]|nr:hydantoinase/oxoprolinase family protein [Alphaproteobacteria bacterium]